MSQTGWIIGLTLLIVVIVLVAVFFKESSAWSEDLSGNFFSEVLSSGFLEGSFDEIFGSKSS